MSYKYLAEATFEAKLTLIDGHIFAHIDSREWLVDTGAPTSFGLSSSIEINNKKFRLHNNYLGLNAKELSMHTGHVVHGLIGTDILNEFNVVMDLENNQIAFSNEQVAIDGSEIPMHSFMGIPIIDINIDGQSAKVFFDTGAQISYWDDVDSNRHSSVGVMHDFYPGIGRFETNIYPLNVDIGGKGFAIKFGVLPGELKAMLSMAGTSGIIGNEIMKNRVIGYFPNNNQIIIS